MRWKPIWLPIAAMSASTACLLHAASPAASSPTVEITSPNDRDHLPWGARAPYAVVASYDGKSTKYDEFPGNDIVLRATYVPDAKAPSARIAAALPEGLVQISQSNCMGCHDFSASAVGPSFAAIGKRYSGTPNAPEMLADHIRNGSRGMWGSGNMPPHSDLTPGQAKSIAQWIVAQGNDATIQYAIGKSGSFQMTAPTQPGASAGMVLSAFYTGPLKPGDSRDGRAGPSTVVVYGADR